MLVFLQMCQESSKARETGALQTGGPMQAPPLSSESVWQQLSDRLDAGRTRPAALPGIEAFPMHARSGEQYVIIRNPTGSAFLRLAPWQYNILTAMDGTRTVKDLLLRNFQAQGVLELNGITSLIGDLRANGFVHAPQGDIYAALHRRLYRKGRYRTFLDQIVNTLSCARRVRAVETAGSAICRVLAPLCRGRVFSLLFLLLALAGLILPLVEGFGSGQYVGNNPGNAAVVLISLWCASLIYALAGGIGTAALGRTPQRAGICLRAGIPLPWIDPQEALATGPDGPLIVWWARPVALLACAGILGLAALYLDFVLVAALTCAILGVAALAPPLALSSRGLAPHAWNLHALRTHRWSRRPATWPFLRGRYQSTPAARRAVLAFDTLTMIWALILLGELVVLWHVGIAMLPHAVWNAANPAARALLVIAVIAVVACATLQYGIPAIRRRGRSGTLTHAVHTRYRARGLGKRLAVMRLSTVLGSLTEEQMLALAREVEEVRYPDGVDVVVQGEMCSELFIVMEGTARVIDEGGPTVLEILQRGKSFGRQAMLYHALNATTVRAASDLRLLRIGRAAFDAYLAPRLLLDERLAALSHECQALAAVPMLASLGPQAISLLLTRLIIEHYEPNVAIVRQGEQGETFYIIRSGTVEVLDEQHDPPRRLNVLGTGAYFGEVALLFDTPRIATVRALVEVTVWRLSRGDFDLVLGRYLGLGDTISHTSQQRIEANRVLNDFQPRIEDRQARSA